MTIPTFFVQWVDPNDTTLGLDFFPPKGSDELHEALKQYYPHLNNLQARMRQASIDFLLDKDQANSAQVSPVTDNPTPNYLPSPSSFPPSAVASPSDATSTPLVQQNSAVPRQEELMTVWTLPSNPDARIHKRRTMTAEEKRAYKQKRLEGACADCKRRRRKCQHGASASPAASSSSSSKPTRRKARSKASLEVPSPSDAIFNAISMDQCFLPERQPSHESIAFNLFNDLPSSFDLADGVSTMEMDFASSLDNDFLDLNNDWELFPDTQYDRHALFQPPHAIDPRQCSATDTNTIRNSSHYSDSPGGFETWSPTLDYQSLALETYDQPTSSINSGQVAIVRYSSPAAGLRPIDSFYGLDNVMQTSPSSSSQGSFSDTGHIPGGSCLSPSTSDSSDMQTNWNCVPRSSHSPIAGFPQWDLSRHASGHVMAISRSKKPEQIECRERDRRGSDGPLSVSSRPQLVASRIRSASSNSETTSIGEPVERPGRTRDQPLFSMSPHARPSSISFSQDIRVMPQPQQSSISFSQDTRGAPESHPVTTASPVVCVPGSVAIFSARVIQGADHSLSKPGHPSLHGRSSVTMSSSISTGGGASECASRILANSHASHVPLSISHGQWSTGQLDTMTGHLASGPVTASCSTVSQATSISWRASESSRLAGQNVQVSLGAMYMFALLRASPPGKKVNGMFLGVLLAVMAFLLSHHECGLR